MLRKTLGGFKSARGCKGGGKAEEGASQHINSSRTAIQAPILRFIEKRLRVIEKRKIEIQ